MFSQEIEKHKYDQEFRIEKSVNPELISIYEFQDMLKSEYDLVEIEAEDGIEKAERDLSHLIKKEVWVQRGGKSFKQTVYVKIKDEEKVETPVGGELSPEVKGMKITKYSDKALLITGDTKVNLETLRSIKKDVGVGSWNNRLGGWVFPIKYVETVLGYIWSGLKDKGEDEKADAVQNQKNAGLDVGDKANIQGIEGEVKENVSDSKGTKYNVKLNDGTELNGVDEKVISKEPETNDKKISEAVNNVSPESRVPTEKKIWGIRPVKDIHNYSLSEYMAMHGISQEDINKTIANLTKPKTGDKKRSGGGSGTSKKKESVDGGMTKKQLIAKLVYAHYQAVQQAIKNGEAVKPEALATYTDLQQLSKDRKPMSEETKRKISEALKKNKVEAKEAAQKMIDSLSKEDIEKIKSGFEKIVNEEVTKEQSILAEMIVEKKEVDAKEKELWNKLKDAEDYTERGKINEERSVVRAKQDELSLSIRNQQNKVQAISNGGDLATIKDKIGTEYKELPDFRKVSSLDIDYDVDNILTKERPVYIPEINEGRFRDGGYIFDTVKVGEDAYLLSTNRHSEKSNVRDKSGVLNMGEGGFDSKQGGYVMLTLDQLVLTQDYYVTKQKAKFQERADERNRRQLENWNEKDDKTKERYMMQRGIYRALPAKVKKQIPEDKWDKMGWQEREKHYKPIKKYGVERLKSKFDEHHMAVSFHDMHQRFIDPEAHKVDRNRKPLKLGESSVGNYGHPKAFASWRDFKETLDWKINDIRIQREEISDIRNKALETSYGDLNTNNSLVDDLGIKVKRQNGEDIKPQEIEQIKGAWVDIQKSFGSLKENAKKDNLKLSHAGKTYMYASKASGVYVSKYKTIGVTAKHGEDQLGFTMSHEVAHWIDHTLGEKNGRRYASDNYESTAGKIATTLRKNMNQESKSQYVNSIKECFARSLEMYHAIETKGEGAFMLDGEKYVAAKQYVSKDVYNKQLKPLIKQFLEENKDILKSMELDLFK
jgi:hypothetical protein